jgi:tetratricopeptide (TPR) repeat protein
MKHTLVALGAGLVLVSVFNTGCVQRERTLVGSRDAGDDALRNGEYALAAQEYERYLEERPARREVMYDLGRAYEGLGEMSAAREAYTLAYELDPFNPEYIDAMARATAANGEIDAAFDLLEGIARESDRSDAYGRLGAFLLEFGFPDEGVLAYRTAARVDPSASAYLELAEVLDGFEEREAAMTALSHALWFEPANDEVRAMVRRLGGVPGPTFAAEPTP